MLYKDPTLTEGYPQAGHVIKCNGRNLTSIGPSPLRIAPSSQIDPVLEATDGRELVAQQGHLLASEKGATILYRYENGQLTDQPLWPWPMNQRIIDAMELAGYDDPVDVTKTIFELAGGKVPDFGGE